MDVKHAYDAVARHAETIRLDGPAPLREEGELLLKAMARGYVCFEAWIPVECRCRRPRYCMLTNTLFARLWLDDPRCCTCRAGPTMEIDEGYLPVKKN